MDLPEDDLANMMITAIFELYGERVETPEAAAKFIGDNLDKVPEIARWAVRKIEPSMTPYEDIVLITKPSTGSTDIFLDDE